MYIYLAALGGVFNILLMMTANLVGFVLGTEGTQVLMKGIFNMNGGVFLGITIFCLWCAVMVMFDIRDREQHKRDRV